MKSFGKIYIGVSVALVACAVLFQNCAAAPPPDLSQLSQSSVGGGGVVPVPTAAACMFNNQTIPSGGSITAWQSASVPSGATCQNQTRSCNNGVLSGTYVYDSCSVQSSSGTATCNFNNTTIAHGGSVTAYQSSSVPYGSTCNSESRVCTNGTLSGTFMYSRCIVQAANPTSCKLTSYVGGIAITTPCP